MPGKDDGGERKHQNGTRRKRLVDDESDGKPVQQSQADVDHDAERQRLHAEAKQEPVVDAEGTVRGGHLALEKTRPAAVTGSAITIADCTTAPVFP